MTIQTVPVIFGAAQQRVAADATLRSGAKHCERYLVTQQSIWHPGTVLFQVNVGDKENEISALKPLLTPSFLKGRIFTLDAMHTQTELCTKVHRFDGWYVLLAKDHQPTLATDLADFFGSPPPDWQWTQAESWEKAHRHLPLLCGQEEKREGKLGWR